MCVYRTEPALTLSVGVKRRGKCVRSILLGVVVVHHVKVVVVQAIGLDVSDVASVTK